MLHVATTSKEKAMGFQHRQAFDGDEAMLFIDVGPDVVFHMRNVGAALSIASIGPDGSVLDVGLMEPETGAYVTAKSTVYVLEAAPEFFSDNQISEGFDVSALLLSMPQTEDYFSDGFSLTSMGAVWYTEQAPLAVEEPMAVASHLAVGHALSQLHKLVGLKRAEQIWTQVFARYKNE